MTQVETRELLRRYALDPKKSLGQNFLTDASHLDRIAEAADLTREDVVLEIGPGLGDLTERLAARAQRVTAIELDDRLIDLLQNRFADQPQVRIVHGDILAHDPFELVQPLAPGAAYKVVANLPYYITSAVLRHILEAKERPSLAVVMVQKEVAERIVAEPGDLSLLAVSVQFYASARIVHHVPAEAFFPPPKVDSAVLRLDVYAEPLLPELSSKRFFHVVRAGFSQKRKQLGNSLSAGLALSKSETQAALRSAGIDPVRRAETLSLEEWGRVVAAFEP